VYQLVNGRNFDGIRIHEANTKIASSLLLNRVTMQKAGGRLTAS